ncbi:MAG: virulence factor TspB C-terminal domain-related protein [Acinetobacter sp.]
MVSSSSFGKKAVAFLIATSLMFQTQTTQASTLAGGSGWRVASTVSNGIGVTVNGVKDVMVNGAKKTMTGVATVTPTASQVGKFMGKNLAGVAVVGVMDLLLDGVDYVMDPANNSVRYKPKSSAPFLYYAFGQSFPSLTQACNHYLSVALQSNGWNLKSANPDNTCTFTHSDGRSTDIVIYSVANPDAPVDSQPKSIPLVNLGSRVIEQAEAEVKTGNPAVPIATPVTQAAAAAVVGEAAKDEPQARPIVAELDKSAAIPTDQTAVGEIAPPATNPETGEVKPGSISLDFPVFCSWAPSLCVMADKVQQAISDVAAEYAETASENTDTELEIPEVEEQNVNTDISFGGSCPATKDVQIRFAGINETIELSYEPLCEIAEFIKPVVIAVASYVGVLIVAGIRTEDD